MRMNKRKIFIVSIYLLTLILFIFIAEINTDNFVRWYMETMSYGNIFIAMGPLLIAINLHMLITLISSIIVMFIKKIDKELKSLIYALPIITLFIWYPIALVISKILYCFSNVFTV